MPRAPAELTEMRVIQRSKIERVTFVHPFKFPGLEETYPAGVYEVETIEEPLDGLSFLAYHRVSTTLQVRDPVNGARQVVTIDPKHLTEALERDARAI